MGVDWLQVIDLTSNVSTLAYNAALSMGALGYTAGSSSSLSPAATPLLTGNCSSFTPPAVTDTNPFGASTLQFLWTELAQNMAAAQFVPSSANPQLLTWQAPVSIVVPTTDLSANADWYTGGGVYTFRNSSAGLLLPVNFTFSLYKQDVYQGVGPLRVSSPPSSPSSPASATALLSTQPPSSRCRRRAVLPTPTRPVLRLPCGC